MFFDNGFARYIERNEAFLLFEPNDIPAHLDENHLSFLDAYFDRYPQKTMAQLKINDILSAFYDNRWQITRVVDVDCSLVRLHFQETKHFEWLYRGSYRLYTVYEKFKPQKVVKRYTKQVQEPTDENHEPIERCLINGNRFLYKFLVF